MTRRVWALLIVVTVASAGCGSMTIMAPPAVNVTGKWLGNWMFDPVSLGGGQIVMDLRQVGAEVNGTILVTGPSVNRPTTIQAIVTGNEMRLQGRIPGTLTVSADQISGTVEGVVPATVIVQRQR